MAEAISQQPMDLSMIHDLLIQKPDPTHNVLKLVEAAIQRQDDLRAADVRRGDDLMEAERRRVNEQMALRARHYAELRDAEAKRIDAIRAVDVQAVAAASQRGDNAASILATQVANTAETLRSLVATTATAHATALSQITMPIIERLALLEKAQYEGSGKQAVIDPQISALLLEMKAMRESSSRNAGDKAGSKNMVGYFTAGVMFLVALAAVLIAAFKP